MLHFRTTDKFPTVGVLYTSELFPVPQKAPFVVPATRGSPRSPVISFFIGTEQSETVQPGDEILQLAGTAVQGLSRFEAWNVIKALPDGPVTIVIRRKGLPCKPTTASTDS